MGAGRQYSLGPSRPACSPGTESSALDLQGGRGGGAQRRLLSLAKGIGVPTPGLVFLRGRVAWAKSPSLTAGATACVRQDPQVHTSFQASVAGGSGVKEMCFVFVRQCVSESWGFGGVSGWHLCVCACVRVCPCLGFYVHSHVFPYISRVHLQFCVASGLSPPPRILLWPQRHRGKC